MPETSFEEKGKSLKRGLQNSLALRIVTITICFLVLPIIVLGCILYVHEYNQRKENNFFALDLIAHQVQDATSGIIQQNETIAETLEYVINIPGKYAPKRPNRELDHLFSSLTSNNGVSDILYVQREGHSFFCTIASNTVFLGKNLTKPLSKLPLRGQKYVLFSHQFESIGDTLITAHPLYTPGNEEPYGVILIFLRPNLFATKVERATDNRFPISTSLLTDHGRVVASTRMDFLQRRFAIRGHLPNPKIFREESKGPIIPLTPVSSDTGNFMFRFDGVERMAVYLPLQEIQYGILIETSDTVNLITFGTFLLWMLLIFLVIFVSGIIGTILVTFRLSRPLANLCMIMLHVQRGKRNERFTKDRWGFEINLVGKLFNGMLDSIEEQVKQIRRERTEKELLSQELLIGQKIQTSLLPQSLPQVPSLELATGFISAKEVGGDYYDVLVRDVDGRQEVLFSIADASGKGVYACLYSLSIRSMIRASFMKGSLLEETVKEVNNLFHVDAESTSAFVTLWIGIYDVSAKKLTFANCGHHPALHISAAGNIEKLHTSNIALGVVPLKQIEVGEKKIEQGEGLLLFTDGVVEAHNTQNELFGEERVIHIAKGKRGAPQALVKAILEDVKLFSKGVQQHDDIALLSVLFRERLSDER